VRILALAERGKAPQVPGPLLRAPVGTTVHCIELSPGKGAQLARSAGSAVQLLAREGIYAQVRLRSGEKLYALQLDSAASVELTGAQRDEVLAQLELRRALAHYESLEWKGEGLARSASLGALGSLRARFEAAADARPREIAFLDPQGKVQDSCRAIQWDVKGARPVPGALEFWHGETRVWKETVRRVQPMSYTRDAFLPRDRQEGPAATGEAGQPRHRRATGDEPEADLELAEQCVLARGEPQVAGEHELASGAAGASADRGDAHGARALAARAGRDDRARGRRVLRHRPALRGSRALGVEVRRVRPDGCRSGCRRCPAAR
jgi:hypothetical protein